MKHEHKYYSDKNIENKIRRGHAKFENGVLLFRCSCCHDFNPATTEFYHLDRGRLKCKCKKCWVGIHDNNKEIVILSRQKIIYEQFLSLI